MNSALDSDLARVESLVYIGLGSGVGSASLEKAELYSSDLDADPVLDLVSKPYGQTAELRVAESVRRGGLRLGDEGAVCVVDAFGYRDQDLVILVVLVVDFGEELIHIEVGLGEVDEVRARAVVGSESGGGGEPARVSAHDLYDRYHTCVVDSGVLADLHAGGGDVFCRARESGAVVSSEKVVVYSLGNAHDSALPAGLGHESGYLVAGVHRVIAAVVEEVADIVFLEDLQDLLVIRIVVIGVSHLVTAGTEFRRGGVKQKLELFRILFVHDVKLILKNALYAVGGSVYFCDIG